LRGAAAIGVVAFHACQWSGRDFAVGAAGVDVFFLISGFVLWLSIERTSPSPRAFLGARVLRVAPLYWLATLIYALAAWRWPALAPEVHPQAAHILLSLAFMPHIDPVGGPFPLLPSGWTLVYEAFFYGAVAVALALPKDQRFKALAGVLGLTSLLGLAYRDAYTLLANPLLLEFLAGAGLARHWARRRSGGCAPLGWRTGLIGLAAGIGALALEQALGVQDDIWRPVLFGVPAFAILTGALALEAPLRRSGAWAWALVRLGDASYALYLSHLLAVSAVWCLTPCWPAETRIALSMLVALATGLGCWAWIERPMTGALRRRFAPVHPAAEGQPQPLTVPARRAATGAAGLRIGGALGSGTGRPNK
jgi:exopolysaccharide production protein ExoZ